MKGDDRAVVGRVYYMWPGATAGRKSYIEACVLTHVFQVGRGESSMNIGMGHIN